MIYSIATFHLVCMHLGGGGVKSPIHFHCVLHAKRGGWVQHVKLCAYLMEGPITFSYKYQREKSD